MLQRRIVAQLVAQVTPQFMELTQAGSQVTVTVAATALSDLITMADATMTDFSGVNFILLNPEGAVRWLYLSDPTAAKGIKVAANDVVEISGINPTDLMLIASGDVLTNVQIGRIL